MKISAVSFGGFAKKVEANKHEKLQNLANRYSTGSNTDKVLIQLSHDVLDITPWQCSEGDTLVDEDLKKADTFMDTLRKTIIEGNTKLATALGEAIRYHSPVGKANNCGFDKDMPLGEIKNLDVLLLNQKYVKPEEIGIDIENAQRVINVYEDGKTVTRILNPEYIKVSETVKEEFKEPEKSGWNKYLL